ncbi:phage minor capsid protein [Mesobacillus subterraneus]|uniref:phage minor capsid protein n=1 Tax=Mesobacillus subterraneus TaxID=285983 RepID=UPI00203C5C80|nr:phage minor capsid protein [Mesobacillus subterraneus]MCM3573291.1 phage minor capsid protein [Mesobacillus subterraneus]
MTPAQLTDQLIAMYSEASFFLREQIRSLEEGLTKKRKQQLLKQIQDILMDLSENAAQTSREIIETSYQNGAAEAIRELVNQGVAEDFLEPTIKTIIHKEAVQAILDETFYRILEANDNMLEDAKERIEEVTKRANSRSLIQGVSKRQAVKDAVAELLENDITGIVAKNGARIPADKYMANVIHFNMRKAHVEGSINKQTEAGFDLVYINKVGITCDRCAKYQGRVYSLSGEDKRFPKLEVKPPFHGWCVHSSSAWVEEYHDELDIKKTIRDSNKPFTDSRTEANIRKYEEIQRDKSKKNETRKQWIRYKARMPDIPDLRTFASHKARNTKRYQQWMEDFRAFGIEIKKRGG